MITKHCHITDLQLNYYLHNGHFASKNLDESTHIKLTKI